MNQQIQSYSNHVRFHPAFHFFVAPVMLLHFVWSLVRLIQDPGWDRAESVLLAAGLVVMALLVRVNPLKAQDRVIRLEEQLRYARLLSPDLAKRADQLSVGQIVALRFAPDSELSSLVEKVISGKVSKPAEIKKQVLNWRGDYVRI